MIAAGKSIDIGPKQLPFRLLAQVAKRAIGVTFQVIVASYFGRLDQSFIPFRSTSVLLI